MMSANTLSERTLSRISALPCSSLERVLSTIMAAIENDLPKTDIALAAAFALHTEETGGSPKVKLDPASLALMLERVYKSTHPGVIRRSFRKLIQTGVLEFNQPPRPSQQTNKIVREESPKPQTKAPASLENTNGSTITETLNSVIRQIAETNPRAAEILEVLRPAQQGGHWVLTGPSDPVVEYIDDEYGDELSELWQATANEPLPPLRVSNPIRSTSKHRPEPTAEPTPGSVTAQPSARQEQSASPTPEVHHELTPEFIKHASEQIMASGPITDRSEVLAWVLHMVFISPRQPEKYNAYARLRGVIKMLRERRLRRPGGFDLDKVKAALARAGLGDSQLRDAFTDQPSGTISSDEVALVVRALNRKGPNSKRCRVPVAWVLYQVFCDPGNAQTAWCFQSRLRGTMRNIDKDLFRRPTLFSGAILKSHMEAGNCSAFEIEQICSETILRAA
jgi:hypothetical protein